ncbi:biotin--[acetyl-CoA-carboxylase] ligase [Rubidibacter lacunae]|uniref:biotin--[acetyl-CoA-carboxylase] ligase n=1 Tax=Rubidibacter lacunae TaxID=582514 RepID=UPI0018DC1FC9|nr:biotin--[acetyl-CoA-carboxylase] ligase [Rubidibacter lacunae]
MRATSGTSLEGFAGASVEVLFGGDERLRLYRYGTVASTNRTLWALLDAGESLPAAVVATAQTAGRGQRGRTWHSHPGGLYLSVAIAPQLPLRERFMLTASSAWGIASALRDLGIPATIKWPNDLVLDGRKLGGILCETRVRTDTIAVAVIGVGVNWCNPTPATGIDLSSYLAGCGSRAVASLDDLTHLTGAGVLAGWARYSEVGLEIALADYTQLCSSLGRSTVVDGRIGKVVGVMPTGELRIQYGDGTSHCLKEVRRSPGTIGLGYD